MSFVDANKVIHYYAVEGAYNAPALMGKNQK